MKYSENSLNILTAQTYKGIGKAWINKNLKGNEFFEDIAEEVRQKDSQATDADFQKRRLHIQNNIDLLGVNCDGVVALGDENFPKYRGKVKGSEQPIALFYKGDISLLSQENNNIAVIGLLNPDAETEKDERKVVDELVRQGAVIVSGLARGCDSIAHDQTLKSQGKTVAILPSPLNKIQPVENTELANNIIEQGGLVISEYYEQPKSKMEISSRYVERDRLQALFSDIVILTASYAKNDLGNDSGSRHAMGKALDYGLKRAVIYNDDNISNPKYDLNRQIIVDKDVFVIDRLNQNEVITEIFESICKTNIEKTEDLMPSQGSLF